MILGLITLQVASQAFVLFGSLVVPDLNLLSKTPFKRSAEPFRSDLEIQFLQSEYGAIVKQRKPNRWERLALALKKSGNLPE
jgi:hypothetical protein